MVTVPFLVDFGSGLEDCVDEELEELRDSDELHGRRVRGRLRLAVQGGHILGLKYLQGF